MGDVKKVRTACYSVCPTRCISWGESKTLSERIVQEALPQRMK